jgi:hypothetical protein
MRWVLYKEIIMNRSVLPNSSQLLENAVEFCVIFRNARELSGFPGILEKPQSYSRNRAKPVKLLTFWEKLKKNKIKVDKVLKKLKLG